MSTVNIKRIGIVGAFGAALVAVGTGVAGAQPDDGEGNPITGDALAKASAAALAFTGGGTVTSTEVGDEESLYEVEVTRADGSQVDVQLDEAFVVVGSKSEVVGSDTEPDAPGN
jgi:hypothetical protein